MIRNGVAEDSVELTRVARAAKASWGYPAAWLREWESELAISPEYIRNNGVFVAESEGRIVGVVGVEEGPEGPEIGHLWVAPEGQGQGWGGISSRQRRSSRRRVSGRPCGSSPTPTRHPSTRSSEPSTSRTFPRLSPGVRGHGRCYACRSTRNEGRPRFAARPCYPHRLPARWVRQPSLRSAGMSGRKSTATEQRPRDPTG